jgi:Reverse transcriptase (RNA-dependent DNA polymerase).
MGYHNLVVTLDIDSAYPSVSPDKLCSVLLDQGWPESTSLLAADFCTARSFSFRWARSTFHTDSGLPQGSPWSPILFALFTLPLVRPSQGAAFAYMDDHAQHTWSRDPFQLVYHASLRVAELCEKAKGPGLRIDRRKTDALYIPLRGKGVTKTRMDTSRIHVTGGGQDVVPSHSIKWVGVTLDSRLSLKAQVSARATATIAIAGLLTRICNTRRDLPSAAAPRIFRRAVVPSVAYGLVQLDPGPMRAGSNGRLVPTDTLSTFGIAGQVINRTLRALFPVWRTIQTQMLYWLVGTPPEHIWSLERYRWRSWAERHSAGHPISIGLAARPWNGWSRLHQLAHGVRPSSGPWEPKRPGLRAWLGLQPISQPKPPRAPPFDITTMVGGEQISILPMGWLVIQGLSGTP